MIKHIVFFKIKEGLDKPAAAEKIISALLPLKDKIQQIRFYELGINFSERDSAFDLALLSHFDSKEDLESYRNHPLHIEAVKKIKSMVAATAVVDYEIT